MGLTEPSLIRTNTAFVRYHTVLKNELGICHVKEKIDRAQKLGNVIVKCHNYQTKTSIRRKA